MAASLQIAHDHVDAQDENGAQESTVLMVCEVPLPEDRVRFSTTPFPQIQDNNAINLSDEAAVAAVVRLFEEHRGGNLEQTWTSLPLTPTQKSDLYDQLYQNLPLMVYFADNIRFDYDNKSELFSVRMNDPLLEFLIMLMAHEIWRALTDSSKNEDASIQHARQISPVLHGLLYLSGVNPEDCHDADIRSPDLQFRLRSATFPSVILEVTVSRSGKNLRKLAWDYIQYSKGVVKVVIGIHLADGRAKEARLSVWRSRIVHEEGEALPLLVVDEMPSSQVFQDAEGHVQNPTAVLRLSLRDFATDGATTNNVDLGGTTDINITYETLAGLINEAKLLCDNNRDFRNYSQNYLNDRQIRMQERSFSSTDLPSSDDEAKHANQETRAEEEINAADDCSSL